jgi:hypothetical protein
MLKIPLLDQNDSNHSNPLIYTPIYSLLKKEIISNSFHNNLMLKLKLIPFLDSIKKLIILTKSQPKITNIQLKLLIRNISIII